MDFKGRCRCYFTDLGLTYYFFRKIGASSSDMQGMLHENFVFNIEAANYDSFTDYLVWNDCRNGIAVKYLTLREELDVAEAAGIICRNIEFKGTACLKIIYPKRKQMTHISIWQKSKFWN